LNFQDYTSVGVPVRQPCNHLRRAFQTLGNTETQRLFAGWLAILVICEFIVFQPNEYDNNKLLFIWYLLLCGITATFLGGVFRWLSKSGLKDAYKDAGYRTMKQERDAGFFETRSCEVIYSPVFDSLLLAAVCSRQDALVVLPP